MCAKKKKREQRRRDGTNVGKEEQRAGLGTGCSEMIAVKLSYSFLYKISNTGRAIPHIKKFFTKYQWQFLGINFLVIK